MQDGIEVCEVDIPPSALSTKILGLVLSGVPFTDLVLHEGRPVKIRSPDGLVVAENLRDPRTGAVVLETPIVPSREDFRELLGSLDPNWEDRMRDRAMDEGRSFGGDDRLRLNIFYEGEGRFASVIRRFPIAIPSMEDIQAPDALVNMTAKRSGLILVMGQTGAGKSTTCAAMLQRIAGHWPTHIVAVENPIEYVHRDNLATFSQRQVGSLGLSTMALGIEDALRQQPGIIYVSEIRDRQTADAVFFAVDSGHLVIANLHASAPLDGIGRLLRMASTDSDSRQSRCHALANSLVGAVSQTLVPTVNADRKRTGFRAFFEVLPNNQALQHYLAEDQLTEAGTELRKAAEGLQTKLDVHWMNADLAAAVQAKQVLPGDALSRALDVKGLERRIKGA